MKHGFYAFLVPVVLLLGCDSVQEDDGGSGGDVEKVMFVPLQIGNTWTYDRFGKEPGTIAMNQDTTVDGRRYFRWGMGSARRFVTYREEGMELLEINRGGQLVYRFLYYYPDAAPFAVYAQDGHLQDDRFNYFTVIVSTDTAITVAGQSYQTLLYRTLREDTRNNNQIDVRWEEYFAPGVGLVRYRWQGGSFTEDWRLTQYQVGDNPVQP